jgi:hypothetical protein
MPADASKQKYNIKDLSTKSVTLYSTKAHVSRVIDNVRLQPGPNEVEIFGLSPTVDEHSIQIEGQGNASIVDLSVQLVPNRDIYEEVYPDESEAPESESDVEYRDSDDDEDVVKAITDELKGLELQATEAAERQKSANERLATWDRYAKSANTEHLSPDDISKLLAKYEEDRKKIYETHSTATQELKELQKQIRRKEDERFKAARGALKQQEKLEKQKAKERRKKELKRAEKEKEARYLRQERLRYWAKKVYKITLLLESTSLDTPGSSRRNSTDSITLASSSPIAEQSSKPSGKDVVASHSTVSLVLSYVTKEAGWSPRYDLRISSVQKTATIIYRTEFLNRTSETWKDAKLSFSTSQTSYQGLDDVVPFMNAWHVRLGKYDRCSGGLLSPEESTKPRGGRPGGETWNRADVFGLDDKFVPSLQSKRPLQVQKHTGGGALFGSSFGSTANNNTNAGGSGLFGNASLSAVPPPPPSAAPAAHSFSLSSHTEHLVESVDSQLQQNVEQGIRASRAPRARMSTARIFGRNKNYDKSYDEGSANTAAHEPIVEDESEDLDDPDAEYEFQEATWEDNGLTATYDVPGIRTLAPSSLTRRHKIASLHAANIHLSHICVPKLRSAAFLRAKIRNPSSSVTLLKGSAGVTLDGTFLGNMNLPRVSPLQVFDLPLGVDPAIHVNYPKPSVLRSTQGIIFNKESAQIFTRSIWLNNTRPQPVELLVLDQVPVSEDERLRVGIVTPRGLVKEGDSVKAGVSAKEGSSGAVAEKDKKSETWGTAMAKLKKNGEIGWTVIIEGGKGCLLKLEYEARLPPSEKIVPA